MADSDINEEWRTIEGFPDYSVSFFGRVRRDTPCRNTHVGRIIKPKLSAHGYWHVALSFNRKMRRPAVHRLLLIAFLGPPPEGKPWADHINGIKTDNTIFNLEWVSPKENSERASRLGLLAFGERNGWVTHPERVARGDRHGSKTQPWSRARGDGNGARLYPERMRRGVQVAGSKLTSEDVTEIRRRRSGGETQASIASDFNISTSNVYQIERRKTWKHIA